MVASEPGEPLLLYITTTVEVVSMVLVVERPEAQQHQVSKGASVGGYGSQDPEPAEEPIVEEAVGSQSPEASLAPEHLVRSQSPQAHLGSHGLRHRRVPAPGGCFES
jgi:hypothetical protein